MHKPDTPLSYSSFVEAGLCGETWEKAVQEVLQKNRFSCLIKHCFYRTEATNNQDVYAMLFQQLDL